MCGIVGARHEWLVRRGLAPRAAMQRAVAGLSWRGPDGAAVVEAGHWWLGCARLAITQPNSTQPVVRRGGRYAGVSNGAITNARELWARLLPGAERRPVPPNDAWLPLLAVELHDVEALAHLRGHHAYAVIDTHSGALVLGQDRYGEKPFFCLVERDGGAPQLVAFASTPAALRCLGMPAPLPARRLAEWFRRGFADAKRHRFHARSWLEPLPQRGVPLVASPEGSRWWRPWQQQQPPRAWSHAPDTTPLRGRLTASVARCVDTTLPAGLLLSGGIDSSCLAVALRELGRQLPAYQFRAEGSGTKEREAARAVATRCGSSWRPVDAGPEVLDALPRLTQFAGQPLGDPSILAVHATARAAAADGVRILLGGEGADELFLGYRRYRALASLPRLPRLRPLAPRWSMSYAARWMRAAVAANPAAALLAVTPPQFGQVVLAPHLAHRRVWRDLAPCPRGATAAGDRVEQARQDDLDGYLRCDLLPKVDIATMAAGIEARCPWLEGDLAALGAGRTALGKRPVLAAFANDLPAEVLRLPKHGFSLPLDRWFRTDLPWLDLLAEARTQQRPHLRQGGITAVVDRHRSGRSNLGHGLYLLVACELFLRTLEENPNSVPAGPGGAA
ncbi:MAG TPA: asparagine synthase-related protein [Planctomycetota bacterium]